MRRREFIALLGGAVGCWLQAEPAQPAGKLPTIGYLGGTSPTAESEWLAAFTRRLQELGWTEGHTVVIEHRFSGGDRGRAREIASEFVKLGVDLILTGGTENVIAARRATSTIPIVFAVAGDPVGTGLVASLSRPGGNVTGLSVQAVDLAGKKLQLLREVVPRLHRFAILADTGTPAGVLQMHETEAAANTLNLEGVRREVRNADDIAPAIEGLRGGVQALYVANGPLMATERLRIGSLALHVRLPTMHGGRELVEAGGLMSYAPYFPDLYRRSAEYVDKILRGAKAADIPIEQPIKFELVVNLKTAKTLDLSIPQTLLATADKVIE